MKDFKPLNEEEMKVIAEAQEALKQIEQIPCTACHYCTGGCPMQIDIPQLFKVMNRDLLFGDHEDSRRRYANAVKDGGTAGSCIHCLQCEGECPQHIEITSWLEKIAEAFE
jgi:predicted aldo/keto reductase-like oxidoreductase